MTPPTEAPAPRLTKGERTQARILDSAAELFSRSGFHAVSLRDIAAHAGLTHAGLLHHFPGKDALLIEVLSRRDREDARIMLDTDPATQPELVLAHLVGVVDRNMHTPGLVGLYVRISSEAGDPEHPAHHYFVERYRLLRQRLTAAFAALSARHDPPLALDPGLFAGQILALMDGLQTQWLLEPEAVDMRASVVAFLSGLGLDLSAAPPFPLWHGGADDDGAADVA